MVKHTPGPWTIQIFLKQDPYAPIWILGAEPDSVLIARMGSTMGINDAPVDEELANARLIAAAPEMLEALKSVLAEYSGGKGRKGKDFSLNDIGAIIAKAEEG